MSARNTKLESERSGPDSGVARRGIRTKPSRPAPREQLEPSAMSAPLDELEQAVAAHDRAIARHGVAVWVGAEPTFTDRFAESREWLSEALGRDKESSAPGSCWWRCARATPARCCCARSGVSTPASRCHAG